MSGLQPSVFFLPPTWALGLGWYVSRVWRWLGEPAKPMADCVEHAQGMMAGLDMGCTG